MYKLGLEKAEESEIKLPTLISSWRNQGTSTKIPISASLKIFDCVDHNKLWKFLKRWEYQTTLLVSWEICVWVKKQQLELDMEQWSGSKLGKEYIKAAYLTHMQSTSCEKPAWMNHKLESRLPGEISTTSDIVQMIPP